MNGNFDDELDKIKDSVRERKAILNRMTFIEINEGDIVRFNSQTRPNYLFKSNIRARVIRKLNKNIEVEVLEEDRAKARRFGRGKFSTPISLIERVEV